MSPNENEPGGSFNEYRRLLLAELERLDESLTKLEVRVRKNEDDASNLRGKLWLPMLAIAGVTAALTAGAFKLLLSLGGTP